MPNQPLPRSRKTNFSNTNEIPVDTTRVNFQVNVKDEVSAYVEGGTSLPAAHHTTHESGGSDEIKLDDLATPDDNTDLNASTGTHGLLRKLANDATKYLDGAGNWTTPGTSGGSSDTTSEMWAQPASPSSYDDEFLAGSLNGAWTLYDSDGSTPITPSGTIDPYATITTGASIETNTCRRSWMAAQVKNTNVDLYLVKAWTPNTNDFVWARMGHTLRPATAANDDTLGLVLMCATSGHPDIANFVEIVWVPNAAGTFAERLIANKIVASATTTIFIGGTYIVDEPYGRGWYLGIQKLGTTYHYWVFDGMGTSLWLGTTTFAGTLAYVGFKMHDNTGGGTKPGNAIFYADFIRVVENTSTFLP